MKAGDLVAVLYFLPATYLGSKNLELFLNAQEPSTAWVHATLLYLIVAVTALLLSQWEHERKGGGRGDG